MKYAFLLSILFLSACQKEAEPTLSERIEGVWIQEFSPHSIYSFSDGLCIQRVNASGKEVYRNEYAYTCQGDTMRLTDLESGSKQVWVVSFPADSTALILTESDFLIGLKRFK